MAEEAAEIEPYLSDDVTVGALLRWIDREHMNAARETPPNRDRMEAMQHGGAHIERVLMLYRSANPVTSAKTVKADIQKEIDSGLPEQLGVWLKQRATAMVESYEIMLLVSRLAERLIWIAPVGSPWKYMRQVSPDNWQPVPDLRGFMVCRRSVNNADAHNTRVDYLRVDESKAERWKKPFRECEHLFPTFKEAVMAAAKSVGIRDIVKTATSTRP